MPVTASKRKEEVETKSESYSVRKKFNGRTETSREPGDKKGNLQEPL